MQDRSPKILALDFDGVVWDSAGECYEVGWRAFQEMEGHSMESSPVREQFLAGRPLARAGRDFYITFRLLHEQPDLQLGSYPYEEFVARRHQWAGRCREFDKVFYRLRNRFRTHQPELWASWQGPYPEVLALLDRWESRFAGTALATTKDQASAKALMAATGRDWPVFGKEFSHDKHDQIVGIATHFHVSCTQVLFLDDLLENLHQVAPTGARLVMAEWGYNTPHSREQALKEGIPVLDVAGLEQHFESLEIGA